MLEKTRTLAILKLALPTTFGLLSSFVIVLIDLAMLSSFGSGTIAAVGIAAFSYTFIVAFVIGVAPAVQGAVARMMGAAEQPDKIVNQLHAGLSLVLFIGLPISALCYWVTPAYFFAITPDPTVAQIGIPYLRTLFVAVVLVGVVQVFHGFWAGLSKTKFCMLALLFINVVKITGNYVLIFGNWGAPALGAQGASAASLLAVGLGVLLYIVVTIKQFGFSCVMQFNPIKPVMKRLFLVGVPEMMREAFFSIGYVVFYAIVAQIGTKELAAMNILIRVALLLSVFALALGMASSTLVANAVGRRDFGDAHRWGWDVGKLGIISGTLIGLPLMFAPEWILSFYLVEPDVIALSILPLQITGACAGITSLIFIFAYTLVSIGDGNRVLLVSFTTQWVFFLPAVWLVATQLHYGLLEVWYVQTAYALLATILMTHLWRDGQWKTIQQNEVPKGAVVELGQAETR